MRLPWNAPSPGEAVKRPIRPLAVAIAVACGLALAPTLDRLGVDPALRWALSAVLLIVAHRHAGLLLAMLVAFGTARGATSPSELAGADDRTLDRVVGVIGAPVIRTPRGMGATLDTGDAVVWLWTDAALQPGERIAATGFLRTPRGPRGPALPDRAAAVASRGADAELVAAPGALERLGDVPGPSDLVWRWAAERQAAGARTIDAAGGDPVGRAALRGIALGDRGEVPPALDARWRALGIYHILSVSGLHLAVIAGLAFALMRRLAAAMSGCLRPARWAAPPALALALAYTLITGAQLATLRALIVITLVLVAAMLDRPIRLIDALGAAAIAILVWRPADLFDPSFQLSFVAALVLAVRPAAAARPTAFVRRVATAIARGVATSTWIVFATAPLTAFHFQQVAVGGVVGNVILTPLVELIALPLTLVGLVTDLAVPIHAAAELVALVDRLAGLLAEVTPVGTVAIASPIMMALLVGIVFALAAQPRRGRGALVVCACVVWGFARTPPPADAMRVTFLDVGQGDAAIIELPGGEVWLIDAGGEPGGRDRAAQTAPGRAIARVLRAYGHSRLDLAIVSHPHPDHYLGLAALAEELPVTELWSVNELEPVAPGPHAPAAASFTAIASELTARGARHVHPPLGLARRIASASGHDVELIVLGPRYRATETAAPIQAADPVRTVNDNSLVLAIRYRGRTLLFVGDLEAEGEATVVDLGGLGSVDVVKVAHHGSPTSSTPAFIAATRPSLAVISCGLANRFGFPSPAVVARWSAAGAEIARTDQDGAIIITIDDRGDLTVERFAR